MTASVAYSERLPVATPEVPTGCYREKDYIVVREKARAEPLP